MAEPGSDPSEEDLRREGAQKSTRFDATNAGLDGDEQRDLEAGIEEEIDELVQNVNRSRAIPQTALLNRLDFDVACGKNEIEADGVKSGKFRMTIVEQKGSAALQNQWLGDTLGASEAAATPGPQYGLAHQYHIGKTWEKDQIVAFLPNEKVEGDDDPGIQHKRTNG